MRIVELPLSLAIEGSQSPRRVTIAAQSRLNRKSTTIVSTFGSMQLYHYENLPLDQLLRALVKVLRLLLRSIISNILAAAPSAGGNSLSSYDREYW